MFLESSSASGAVGNSTISGVRFTMQGSRYVDCEPTTAIMHKPAQARIQNASKSALDSTTVGAHFTRRGSTMEVEVYCEPIKATGKEPTQAPIGSLEDESGYLVPSSFTEKMQLCDQPTNNRVVKPQHGFRNIVYDVDTAPTSRKQNVCYI